MKRNGGHLLSKIHHLSGRVFTKLLKDQGVEDSNPAQGRILFPLWKEDGLSIQELSVRTGLGKSTLTRMLDRLEKDGQISRTNSPDDRRKVFIYLTEQNKAMQGRYEAVSERMTKLFYRGFSDAEIGQFEALLERIFEIIRE